MIKIILDKANSGLGNIPIRRSVLVIFVALSTGIGCSQRYFRQSHEQPSPLQYHTLSEWPYREYWTGIIFNGARIGFSRFRISPTAGRSDLYDIYAEVYFRIRFLMFDKKIKLKSFDQVAHDLSLVRFNHEYDLDGNRLRLKGRQVDNRLELEVVSRGHCQHQTIALNQKVYPSSVITIYPVMHGLALNRSYTYQIFNGQTRAIETVKQSVLTYEQSELFPGRAFKIRTRLNGQHVTSWIDANGKPVLEMSLGGVIISILESRASAQKYLTDAAINKHEALLDYSLIRSNFRIDDPSGVASMQVVFSEINQNVAIPSDQHQQCQSRGEDIFCITNSQIKSDDSMPASVDENHIARYLRPSVSIPSRNPLIRQTAKDAVSETRGRLNRIRSLFDWIRDNIEKKPVDVFTALDVLEGRKAECQGHSILYAAFARAVGIPTRVVHGVVYARNLGGFLYHSWAESLVGGSWVAVDPTLQQIPADATHVKLIEGERMTDLLPLVDLIGHMTIQIVAIDAKN